MVANRVSAATAAACAVTVSLLGALFGSSSFLGCAKSVDFPDGDGGEPAAGGHGGDGPATGGTTTTTELPCGQDCSQIQAPPCFEAVCNEGEHPGPVGSCVVVPSEAGGACDDGQFCTVDDSCDGNGVCVGGPQNDCGIVAAECEYVTCTESTQSCATVAAANGDPCVSADLCLVGTSCNNGLCTGTLNDCFFSPVPDECHVAVCNPTNGMCEPQPGNEGGPCIDQSDLCTVGHTCAGGVCSGGAPKNCDHLSIGCNTGVCDSATGQCVAQPIMNGAPCNDQNNCTTGELCQSGSCTGGTPITQCIGGDLCCPVGCVEATDPDCSCAVNHALAATASSSGGGSNTSGYGPDNWNDGVNGATCEAASCNQCQGWVANSTSPSGAWMMYEWPGPVTIGSMHIDTTTCGASCGNGRLVEDGEVQWWDGAQWVTATTFSNQAGDFTLTFPQLLNTTKVRLFNITTSSCGQTTNSLVYEWYVWPGTGCSP